MVGINGFGCHANLASLVLIGTVLTTAGATVQVRDSSKGPVQTPAGVISGVVVAADTGRALQEVTVSIRSNELRLSRSVVTDSSGWFIFSELPFGRYTLSSSKAGYLDVTWGQRQPGGIGPGMPIVLTQGRRPENLSLAMPRGGAIEGRVMDESGEGVFGAEVRLMRLIWLNGARVPQSLRNNAVTDDRGYYRISALTPGDYLVVAKPRDSEVDALIAEAKSQAAAQGGAVKFVNPKPEQIRALMKQLGYPLSPSLGTSSYTPMFYPGTPESAAATVVTVSVGQQLTGIDIALSRIAMSQIAGVLVSTSRPLLEAAQVFLVGTDPMTTTQTTRPAADGRFAFQHVTPGSYSVEARSVSASNPHADRYWGSAPVVVGPGEATEVSLSLRRGVIASGTLALDTGAQLDTTSLEVVFGPMARGAKDAPVRAKVDPLGRWSAAGLPPGRYQVSVSGLRDGTMTKSAMLRGVDILDGLLEVDGEHGIDGLTILLTTRISELTGRIVERTGQLVEGGTVVLFARDSRYWRAHSRRVRTARSASDGTYRIRGLPPGSYAMLATFDIDPQQVFQASFLQELLSRSMTFTLADGERRVQDVVALDIR
jgi:protocatechuate 3,4-dioxygenase beta subunit